MKKIKLVAILILLCLTFSFSVFSYDLDYLVYEIGDSSINYRLYLPDDWQKISYPVVLFLHGAGQRGDDNEKQLDGGLGTWLFDYSYIDDYPAIYVFPQVPDGEKWVDVDWRLGSYSTDDIPETNSAALAYSLTLEIVGKYNADASRIYLTGISMGGYGVWDMLIRHSGIFAAAIPVCGGGDASKAELINIPIWAFHGDRDSTVPYSGSYDMCKAVSEAGGNAKLTTFEGMDHLIWNDVYSDKAVLDWLFSQTLTEADVTTSTAAVSESFDITEAVTETAAPEILKTESSETDEKNDGKPTLVQTVAIIVVSLLLMSAAIVVNVKKNQNNTR